MSATIRLQPRLYSVKNTQNALESRVAPLMSISSLWRFATFPSWHRGGTV